MPVIIGTSGNDNLQGGSDDDRIEGREGDDILRGGDGADTLIGNQGNDELYGEEGNDILYGAYGTDRLVGGAGNDIYEILVVSPGPVIIEEEDGGFDTVLSAIDITLADNLENLRLYKQALIGTGNDSDNVISSRDNSLNPTNNTFDGLGGNDTLFGGSGRDVLRGGAGDDKLHTNGGDSLSGGSGNDEFILADSIRLAGGVLSGGLGDDNYHISRPQHLSSFSISELDGEGFDTFFTRFSFTLPENFEGLVLGGSAENGTGNISDNEITGNSSENKLSGEGGRDRLQGLEGNDHLDGGTGADSLDGGTGDDTFIVDDAADQTIEAVGGGFDTVRSSVSIVLGANVEALILTGTAAISGSGNAEANLIGGNIGNNRLEGYLGDDELSGGAGDDAIDGGLGDDRLDGGGRHDQVAGGGGHDRLTGGSGNDVLAGNSGHDILSGEAGSDRLIGGSGDDVVGGGDGNDMLDGSRGIDTASYSSASAGVEVNLAIATRQDTGGGGVDRLAGLENLIGSNFDDLLVGTSGANILEGRGGDDRIEAAGGMDRIDGGSGSDTAIFASAAAGLAIDLRLTTPQGAGPDPLTIVNVENLVGSSHRDDFHGDEAANRLNGSEGDDLLDGFCGDDVLLGGLGDDLLDGGADTDRLVGGAGSDTYRIDRAGDIVVEEADEGSELVIASSNYVLSNHVEDLRLIGGGRAGTGNDLGNRIIGSAGDDTLRGLSGEDVLNGGLGDDILSGGDSNDRLTGGEGADVLTGGAGADLYLFDEGEVSGAKASADIITAFSGYQGDRIDLSAIDADSSTSRDDAFTFVGSDIFSGAAGELRFQVVDGNSFIEGDQDGDGAADFFIRLDGTPPLVEADFIL